LRLTSERGGGLLEMWIGYKNATLQLCIKPFHIPQQPKHSTRIVLKYISKKTESKKLSSPLPLKNIYQKQKTHFQKTKSLN
jgi:hypothetical protein